MVGAWMSKRDARGTLIGKSHFVVFDARPICAALTRPDGSPLLAEFTSTFEPEVKFADRCTWCRRALRRSDLDDSCAKSDT